MATDFKLPFSAGAETSGVSYDPRRQLPALDGRGTQVTQSGGKPAFDVGSTIDAQFGDGEATTPSADEFAAPTGPTSGDLNNRTDAYKAKKKAVFAEMAAKSAKQKKLAQSHAKDLVKRRKLKQGIDSREAKQAKSKEQQAARRGRVGVEVAAQMNRRKMWAGINQAQQKSEVARQVKVDTNQKIEVKTTDTKVTNVKDTGVRDANLALADPSKRPL
jgi:hypothetical protein